MKSTILLIILCQWLLDEVQVEGFGLCLNFNTQSFRSNAQRVKTPMMTKMSAVNLNLSNSLSASSSTSSSSSSSSLLASVIDDEGTNGETILNVGKNSNEVEANSTATTATTTATATKAAAAKFVTKEFGVASSKADGPMNEIQTAKITKEIISKVKPNESTILTSPPLTFQKYLSMQGKRVQVKIRYSATPGLRPYFLTVAKKIKMHNPDVIVEKVILPAIDDDAELDDTIFEVMVDGKIVIGKPRTKWTNVRRSGKDEIDNNKMFGMSFFVCMEDINVAIGKARKKKRPNATVYAPEDRARSIGLEMLKGSDDADDE